MFVRLFSFSPTPSIVFDVAVEKCALPLSGPLVDHRPRMEWLEEVDVTLGLRRDRHNVLNVVFRRFCD